MTSTYKDSLNLPQTGFPMKATLPTREPLILAQWERQGLYEQLRQHRIKKNKYILHDGPVYANGHIHIGHTINKVLKDMVCKSKSLSGFDAPFTPGWDCHGLPIELNVEKQFKAQKKPYTPKTFRDACRKYATEQLHIQREEFKRLGILAHWERPYSTMDFAVEADTIRAFGSCIEKGYIEVGLKPIHWCIACQSALSELEVIHQNKQSTAIDVKFEVSNESAALSHFPGKGALAFAIWTTTPWTLPANEAVAIGTNMEYCLIQLAHERLFIAKCLYQSCLASYNVKNYELLGTYPADSLLGLTLKHPLERRTVPLITSDHVLTNKGTGVVHVAPSHGPEDYLLGLQHQLPMRHLVDDKGQYLPEARYLYQQSVLKADSFVTAALQKNGSLLAQQHFTHSYPHCWRHKVPLIFRATSQWFLRLKDANLYRKFKKALKTVNWVPNWGESKMRSMLGDTEETARPDWCLSRQRYWGVPLTLFIHKKTGAPHPNMLEYIAIIAKAVEKEGAEAWYNLDTQSLMGNEAEDYYGLTDVLDVWFDSGVTHYTILKKNPELRWPADLYLEGSDQFRGWFQSSLITGVILDEEAPYRNVLVHGFTVDDKGQKMSKSVGNTLSPDTIIQKWGADILRLWVAATDTRTEIVTSQETFQRIAETYRRIRNTLRFLLGALHEFNPLVDSVPHEKLLSMDRWLLARAISTQEVIQEGYKSFNFPLVYQAIHHFCTDELGSIYLSILKDRQYTMQPNSIARRSGQTALYHVVEAMLRWLSPILSFTAEEAWQHLPSTDQRAESVFLAEWYPLYVDERTDPLAAFYKKAGSCEKCWEALIKVRNLVNQATETSRKEGHIGSTLEANLVIYIEPKEWLGALLIQLQKELHFIFLTSSVTLVSQQNKKLHAEGVAVEVIPVDDTYRKCERCWHRRQEIGANRAHPNLCMRCTQNLPGGVGESRHYA